MNITNLEPKDWPRVRRAMQDAIAREDAPPELAAAIGARLRAAESAGRKPGAVRWLMAAAAAIVLATAGLAVHLSDRASGLAPAIAAAGHRHHVHCAVERPARPGVRDTDEPSGTLGRRLDEIVRIVTAHAGEGYELLEGHVCRSSGRQYAHVICRSESGIVSVMVTARDGELATGAGGTTSVDGVTVAALPTRDYLTYVVGAPADADRLAISVRDVVATLET